MGLHVAGHNIYTICIIVANQVMLHKFNNYTGWGELLAFVMVINIFTILFIESLMSAFPQVYLIFVPLFSQPVVWSSIVFIMIMVSGFEFAYSRYQSLVDEDTSKNFVRQSDEPVELQELHYENEGGRKSIN